MRLFSRTSGSSGQERMKTSLAREPLARYRRIGASVLYLFLFVGCATGSGWRAVPPTSPTVPSIEERIPRIEARAASGDLTVLIARRDDAPLFSVQLAFMAGYGEDPKDKAGLALVAYALLADHAREIASSDESFNGFGASQSPTVVVEADGARIGATVLPEDLELVLSRLARALETISVTEIELQGAIEEAALSGGARRAHSRIAESTIARIVLGEADDLARPPQGTTVSRARITIRDVEGFFERNLAPDAMAVVVAGPAAPGDVVEMVDRQLKDWSLARSEAIASSSDPRPREAYPVAALPDPSVYDRNRGSSFLSRLLKGNSRSQHPGNNLPVVHAHNQGSPRLVVALGAPAAPSDATGEAALRLAEQALGGALRFRLRDENQVSYRVSHHLTLHRRGGLLAASAFMEAKDASLAEAAARRALADASRWLREDHGFESVRRATLHSLLHETDTICGLGAAMARLFQRRLPPGHYKDVARAIENAPREPATSTLERLLDPKVARILLIGEL